jgi:hypothetical protein
VSLQTRLTALAQAVGADIKAVNARIPSSIAMDSWHTVGGSGEPAFQNAWTNFGGIWSTAGFRKLPNGKVRLRGLVKSGTAPTVFTLPVGYRPPNAVGFPSAQSAGLNVAGYVEINSDGSVLVGPTGASSQAGATLDQVEFDTESVLQVASNAAQPMDSVHIVGNPGEPAFQNAWVNYDTTRTARFRKTPDGAVRLGGTVKSGASGTVVFTLPAGYRPPIERDFIVMAATSGGNGTAYVQVLPTGTVTISAISGSLVGTYTMLDGVVFDTETITSYVSASLPALPITLDSWHIVGASGEPAYASPWRGYGSNVNAIYNDVAFHKSPDGRVTLKGLANNSAATTAPSTIFTLPVGYRPPRQEVFLVMAATGAQRLDVMTDGTVSFSPALATGNFVSLDEVEFDTESVAQIASVGTQPMEGLHYVGGAGEPAFTNSWVNTDANRPARFRKYPDGRVRLSGVIQGGASGSIAFTLPVGYRPNSPTTSSVFAVVAGTTGQTAQVAVYFDGRVIPTSGSGNVATVTVLDGIEFDTEAVSSYPTGLVAISSPDLVAVLPASPVNGQEVYYLADAANGIVWHLRYRADSPLAYKWEVLGGSSLSALGGGGSTASTAFSVPATLVSVTVPLSGIYQIEHGSEILNATAGSGGAMSYAVGAAAPLETDRAIIYSPTANAPLTTVVRRQKTLAAGTVLAARIRSALSGTSTFTGMFLNVMPTAVSST